MPGVTLPVFVGEIKEEWDVTAIQIVNKLHINHPSLKPARVSLYKLDGKCCIDPQPPVFSPDVSELGVTWAVACFIACGYCAAPSSPLGSLAFLLAFPGLVFRALSLGCSFLHDVIESNHVCVCVYDCRLTPRISSIRSSSARETEAQFTSKGSFSLPWSLLKK